MKVSLPAFLAVLESDRYNGAITVRFRNGQPVAVDMITTKTIPIESAANGSRRSPVATARAAARPAEEAAPHLR